jgi:hypothetical protein
LAERKRAVRRRIERFPNLAALLDARGASAAELLREYLGVRNDRNMLARVRAGRDVCWVEDDGDEEPLVTVAIPTYRRADLVRRAIASACSQSYERLEILVVGDHCDEATEHSVRSVQDPRLRFINLGHRGLYPEEPKQRWSVQSTKPVNVAIDLARGAWIVGCDDDDELLPNHVADLLSFAKASRLEMAYGQAEAIKRSPLGEEMRYTIGSEPMRFGAISRGAVLYSMGLRFMHAEPECWRLGDVHDWNLWKRMRLVGVRIGFTPTVVFRHTPAGPTAKT